MKKNSQACSSLEEEALDLEELLAKSREKAEATKSARDRVARLRRELEEFESADLPDQDSNQDPDPQPAPAAPDVASALAATLQSAVIIYLHKFQVTSQRSRFFCCCFRHNLYICNQYVGLWL